MQSDIISYIASLMGRERSDIEAMVTALGGVLISCLSDGDSVAIPSFGTFSVSKDDEHITTDLTTGERLLMPPCISPVFNPSSLLKRRVSNTDAK